MADLVASEERRVAVAVDESEESMYALRWFLQNLVPKKISHPNTTTTTTTIILIYARPPPPTFSPLDGTVFLASEEVVASMDRYSRDLANSVMQRAEKICKDHDSNIKVEVKVSSGDPRDVICEVVEKVGADMLVVGSHGYGFIKRALLGSVSDHCARNAKCPVLIVKRPIK